MRFVRAYYRAGVCVAVAEQETPFTGPAVADADEVEVGLVEDFDAQGAAPSKRLFECVSQGVPLPAAVIDCPTSLEGIRQRVREGGTQAVPVKARAWLTFMVPEHAQQMNLHRGITVSALKALDDMRARRDPHVGSRRVNLEREAQRQSDARTAGALAKKTPVVVVPIPAPAQEPVVIPVLDPEVVAALVAKAIAQRDEKGS